MAITKKKKKKAATPKRVVDELYQRYTDNVIQTLASDQFYGFFLENLKQGERNFQFSNRQLKKSVDEEWVKAVEACIEPFNNIIMNPRNFIITKEEIVNVAVARQSTPDVIRHLTTHGAYVDEVNEDNVRPNHLLNKFNEDTWNTYENRFVFTLLEKTVDFVSKRYNALFAISGDEFGTFLKADTFSKNHQDYVKVNLDIRLRKNEEELNDDEDSTNILTRVAKLNEKLSIYNGSQFAKTMRMYARVKNPIVKTNAIRKNPNFKACYVLWEFLHAYTDIGYKIDIYEQSNQINAGFEEDIFHSIFFNYLILKNYLEQYQDRLIDTTRSYSKKTVKPRYIRQIVEEVVKNYDLPDVEVRKVLVDRVTKAQLAEMDSKERKRLVEEKQRQDGEKRKRDAIRKNKEQKRAQQERAKALRAKEEEKARRERELEKRRETVRKRAAAILGEMERFDKDLMNALNDRRRTAEELQRQLAALESNDTSLNHVKLSGKKSKETPKIPEPEEQKPLEIPQEAVQEAPAEEIPQPIAQEPTAEANPVPEETPSIPAVEEPAPTAEPEALLQPVTVPAQEVPPEEDSPNEAPESSRGGIRNLFDRLINPNRK